MNNQDKTNFSLDDEEIVEEEVIDRDEEYDDDDYDDEGYDDEEYDDGEYDDEEYEDEDGYNDDYYDDRLNKVLDELAELKRGMVPAAVQQPQQPMPPQYIYQPTAPPAGSEVVMYNEISRLRDELARNQNSLEMQKELTRIKEDMQRDQRFAEAQYTAEIQRLQSKIDDLLKNGSSPQGELPAGSEAARIEGGSNTLDLDKLLSINEAVLRAMRESDARIQSEIAQLKKHLEEMPSVKELNGAVSAVKKAASNMGNGSGGDFSQLSSDIAALTAALEGNGVRATGGNAAASESVSAPSGGEVGSAELLRQLYEIKTVIGNASAAAVKRAQLLSDLVCDFKKVTFDVHSQTTSYKDKLASVYGFVKKLSDCNEPDAIDLIEATNTVINELTAQSVTPSVFADLTAFCNERGITAVTSAMRDGAERFFGLKKKLLDAAVDSYGDYLPDIVAEINVLQSNKFEAENAALVGEITSALLDEGSDKAEIKSMVESLTDVSVADIVELPHVELPKTYKPAHAPNDENLFTKLAELKAAVQDRPAYVAPARSEGDGEQAAVGDDSIQQVLYAVDELKRKMESATDSADIADGLEELRNNYIDITNRIVEISEKLQEPITVESSADSGMDEEDRRLALDDLAYIRAKLEDYDTFFNSITELRNDIAGMGGSAEISEQLAEQMSTLMSEITTQFDKLYEDLTNVLLESEANIISRFGDGLATTENLESAKTEIIADTQAIRDSLMSITDALLSSTTTDAVEQLHADVSSFIEQSAANTDAASADRQKLLDDIAFLREQAELAISESEQIPDAAEAVQDSEKFISYLDEIAARVALITTISEDTAVIKETVGTVTDGVSAVTDGLVTVGDNIAAVNDNIVALGDSLAVVSDSVNAVSEGIATINDGVTAVTETVRPLAEDVVAAREAAISALDALAPITEQINAILEKLEPADDGAEEVEPIADADAETVDDLAEVKESLGTVLDTLTLMPQAEDVVAARDNTYAILDSLSLAPQAEDVVTIRDNVAALLESVNMLTDNINAVMTVQDGQASATEKIDAIKDSIDVAADDVRFIRTMMEENPSASETLDGIVEDLKNVLDKIEQYEQTSAANKQEIIDAVGGIREEIHINTLDENMSAVGMDGETREALLGEIAEIRERLVGIENSTQAMADVNTAAIDGITAQITDLQAAIEARLDEVPDDGNPTADIDGENMQALISEISAIREKLDAAPEYDTVEEILSLREDIKAARIVDHDEVSGELESIKNELASISSGNILDEIRALREDISNLPTGDGSSVPTDGEINLVLNEIVSLRDEVFAFKDEVLGSVGVAAEETEQPEPAESNDDISIIIDELTALRADQTALTDNIDELKDIISRRTSISASEGEDGGEAIASSGEIDVVLDEIINLKNDIDRIEESLGGDRLGEIAEQVEEIRAAMDELRGGTAADEGSAIPQAVDLTAIMEQFDVVNAALDDIRLNQETVPSEDGGVTGTLAERFDVLQSEIADIKATVQDIAPVDYASEIAEMRAEIDALRAENEQLKVESTDALSAQIADLKETIRDMALAMTPTATADGDTSYAALIDEIRGLKEQVALTAAQPVAAQATLDDDTMQAIRDLVAERSDRGSFGDELGEIRDEIAQLRSLTTVAAESGGNAEVAAIRDEIAELKSMISASDSLVGVAEDVTTIKADVQTLKDEPDLGVMSEILALRDEFQALREQIEDVKRIAGETEREQDNSLVSEIQSLRDQLFAISMANVNDPASGETNYESYNNIILDELASLGEQISTAGSASDIDAVAEELAAIKASIDEREELYDSLAERVARLDNDATNNKILDELASLRAEMANQRDADLTTLNFMSEMAHLLERQNQYLTQNAGTKISDEIESLKAEIASSDAVAEEVAKLREVMTQSGNASDNETILAELADLREELSREKPSRENALILDAIARLRDEITVLAEREQARDISSDADLSDSLSDLKEQLNEIAGIVEPAEQPAPAVSQKKPTTGKKRGRKPGQKNGTKSSTTSGTGKKRGRKPTQKVGSSARAESVERDGSVAQTEIPTAVTESYQAQMPEYKSFDEVIDEQVGMLADNGGEMSLDPTVTADTMDVADRLAKQVANKLIMEQLVEQLGDGGVSEDRVDEILRDILPQEFTTIAETETSDKIRRLANQLVLNKLRSRLNGKNSDDE